MNTDSDDLCPDCDNPVNEYGDTTQTDDEIRCCNPGASHPGDCDTCLYVECDRSC